MAGAPGGTAARIGVRVASALAAALVVAVVLVVGGVVLVLLVSGSLGDRVDEPVRQAVTGTLTFYVLIAVPILIVVTGLVTFLFAGRALSAVERLRVRAAAAVDQRPGPPLPEPAGQDEVARLAQTLDALVGRLVEAEDARPRPVEHPDPGPPLDQVTGPVAATGPQPAVRPRPPAPPRADDSGAVTTVITPLVRGPRDVRPVRDEDAREDPITAPRGIPVVRPGEGSGAWRYPNQLQPGPHQSGPNQSGPQPTPTNPRGVPVSDPRGAPPDARRPSGPGW